MNFTYVLIILQLVVLVAMVVLLYSENKKMEKQYEEILKIVKFLL